MGGGKPPAHEAVGGVEGSDSLRVRFGEELPQRVADPREVLLELRLVPALVLEADQLDDAAGIDHVVGRVEDAALPEPLGILGLGELVVRAAGDRPARKAGDGFDVERAADGARRVDLHLGLERVLGRNRFAAGRSGPRLVDVADEHVRAGVCQLSRDNRAHGARALNEDAAAG